MLKIKNFFLKHYYFLKLDFYFYTLRRRMNLYRILLSKNDIIIHSIGFITSLIIGFLLFYIFNADIYCYIGGLVALICFSIYSSDAIEYPVTDEEYRKLLQDSFNILEKVFENKENELKSHENN